jgi:hypothetical protein
LVSVVVEDGADQWRLSGEYTDFTSEKTLYRRHIARSCDNGWEIGDTVSLPETKKASLMVRSFIHLHPAVQATKESNGVMCYTTQGKVLIEPFGFAQCTLEKGVPPPNTQGWYFPDFGVAIPSVTIIFHQALSNYDDRIGMGYRIKPC